MMLLAMFFQYDNCEAIAAVRDDDEHRKFEAEWYSFSKDFCPKCRTKPETQAAQEADRRIINSFVEENEHSIRTF